MVGEAAGNYYLLISCLVLFLFAWTQQYRNIRVFVRCTLSVCHVFMHNSMKCEKRKSVGFQGHSLIWSRILSSVSQWIHVETLTQWGRVTHIHVNKLTIIGSDNGLSSGRHRAIIWTNTGMISIRTLETNFSAILIEVRIFTLKKMQFYMSTKWRQFFSASMR